MAIMAQRDIQKNSEHFSFWPLFLFTLPLLVLVFPVLFSPLPVLDLPGLLVDTTLSSKGSTQVTVQSPIQSHSLPSSLPVKSSGAIWIGVPTMLPDIMASGLQNPKSVILARFCLSSCQQSRVRVTLCLILHRAFSSAASPNSQVGVYLIAVLNQFRLQPPCFQIHSQ